MQNNFNITKIAFFGTPDFTVQFLELFKSIGLEISLVVTGEDKPVGRGQFMRSPGPKVFAEQNNIKYLQPKQLSEIEDELVGLDLFIVIAYGKIIPEKIINLPKHGTINLHYSLLPKYRGASPVESAILNGETETGITIQQMVYKLDAGNILFQEKINIDDNETANELRERMNKRALEILPEFLANLSGGTAQNEQEATSCGKFSKADFDVTGEVEKNDLKNIYTKYKAFDKRIFFFFGEKKLRVKITEMNKDGILKVLPESKKEISITNFENSFGKIFK